MVLPTGAGKSLCFMILGLTATLPPSLLEPAHSERTSTDRARGRRIVLGGGLATALPCLRENLSCQYRFYPVGLQLGSGFLTFSLKLLKGAAVQNVMSCIDTDEHQPLCGVNGADTRHAVSSAGRNYFCLALQLSARPGEQPE